MATGNPKTKWIAQSMPALAEEHMQTEVTLHYKGKASEQEILATQPITALPIWAQHPESPNRLYYGDNLPLLSSLMHDRSVKGNVKLVYIDPPFATNSVFHSRTQVDAYQDLLIGAGFIEFMRKRLILIRELLAEDGSVYVHLDENMAFHMKVIMDEIFGFQNFRNWITRRKCSHKNYTKKTYGNISDYILFYTKSDTYTWNRPTEA
jgi:adenine-specific DNA-methyltransferase